MCLPGASNKGLHVDVHVDEGLAARYAKAAATELALGSQLTQVHRCPSAPIMWGTGQVEWASHGKQHMLANSVEQPGQSLQIVN